MRSRIPSGASARSLSPSVGSCADWPSMLSAWPHSCQATQVNSASRVDRFVSVSAPCLSLMSIRRSSGIHIPREALSAWMRAGPHPSCPAERRRASMATPSGSVTISHRLAPICSKRRRSPTGSTSQASCTSWAVVGSFTGHRYIGCEQLGVRSPVRSTLDPIGRPAEFAVDGSAALVRSTRTWLKCWAFSPSPKSPRDSRRGLLQSTAASRPHARSKAASRARCHAWRERRASRRGRRR